MNRPTSVILFVASIATFPGAVKTRAADLPKVSASSKTDLKDSVKDANDEFKQIVDYMMRYGQTSRLGGHIAPLIGLSGARPVKGDNIRSKKFDKQRGGLNCGVVYEDASDEADYGGKRPICIFLQTAKNAGPDDEYRLYRLSLDGKLERVVVGHGKHDKDGKPIRGSAVNTDEDVNSPAVKKAFAAELSDIRQWLAQKKKTATNPEAASASKPADQPVAAEAKATP